MAVPSTAPPPLSTSAVPAADDNSVSACPPVVRLPLPRRSTWATPTACVRVRPAAFCTVRLRTWAGRPGPALWATSAVVGIGRIGRIRDRGPRDLHRPAWGRCRADAHCITNAQRAARRQREAARPGQRLAVGVERAAVVDGQGCPIPSSGPFSVPTPAPPVAGPVTVTLW